MWLIGYGRWTPCSYFRSSQVFKEIAALKNSVSSQESMQLSLVLVNFWETLAACIFIKNIHSRKIFLLGTLLELFRATIMDLAQIYSSQSLESIVNLVVLVDATKASGWKIEFHTWHTVPTRNAKYCFCKIICFIFLKLLMKVVQSYLYPKAHIPLCPMGWLPS